MTYNQYRMIFYVSFTAFAIMLIASIVILIVLEIPKVIGALTGKSARKGIAAIVQKQTAGHIDITSSGPIAPSYNLAGENKKKPGYTQNIDERLVLNDKILINYISKRNVKKLRIFEERSWIA